MNSPHFTRIEFHNYKALERFTLNLKEVNVLVGPNNAGKSTIIGAFRVLEVALRRAWSRSAEPLRIGNRTVYGHHLAASSLPVSLENVHSNLEEAESWVRFTLSNGHALQLHFPVEENGGPASCFFFGDGPTRSPRSPSQFRREFPVSVGVVPVLGPVEHDEATVARDTVVANLSTHRASRNFRSFWHHFPEDFERFAAMVSRTWPGMAIQRPSLSLGGHIEMFCTEDRMTREIYWAGFGFQVWCQLLSHLLRASAASIVVVDEPEIYLHADLQRRLISLLRDLGPPTLLATHSGEIVAEADSDEILLIDKRRHSARRLKASDDGQDALACLGSAHNMTLTRLARSRRVLFVEGPTDFPLLQRFARKLGLDDLAAGDGLVAVPVGGFSGWTGVLHIARGLSTVLGTQLLLAAVFDADYRSTGEIEDTTAQLAGSLRLVHIHRAKELENYLLVPAALQRAVDAALRSRSVSAEVLVQTHLAEIVEPFRHTVTAQRLDCVVKWEKKARPGIDATTITTQFMRDFDDAWNSSLERRLELVSGKEVLRLLRIRLQSDHNVTLTESAIIKSFRREDVSEQLRDFLGRLNDFRQATLE
ncbi:MAG: AAA family ATPase [bacterium]